MADQAATWQRDRMDRTVRLAEVVPGTRVVDANGMAGTVVSVVPEDEYSENGLRVAWADGNRTVVPARVFRWQADTLVMDAGNAGVLGSDANTTAMSGRPMPGITSERMDAMPPGETLTIPVIEERLTSDVVWREAGVVRVRVRGEAIPQTVTRETEHDELYVEEVAVGRELTEGEQPAPRQEGDVLVVPIVEEEVVVTVRRVLAREVRITRRIAQAPQTVDTTTRHTVVELDPGDLTGRVHFSGNQ